MSRNKSPDQRKLRQFAQAYHAEKSPAWITIDIDALDEMDADTVGTRFCASAPGWQYPPEVEQQSRLRRYQPGTAGFPADADHSQNYALCILNYALRKIAA